MNDSLCQLSSFLQPSSSFEFNGTRFCAMTIAEDSPPANDEYPRQSLPMRVEISGRRPSSVHWPQMDNLPKSLHGSEAEIILSPSPRVSMRKTRYSQVNHHQAKHKVTCPRIKTTSWKMRSTTSPRPLLNLAFRTSMKHAEPMWPITWPWSTILSTCTLPGFILYICSSANSIFWGVSGTFKTHIVPQLWWAPSLPWAVNISTKQTMQARASPKEIRVWRPNSWLRLVCRSLPTSMTLSWSHKLCASCF